MEATGPISRELRRSSAAASAFLRIAILLADSLHLQRFAALEQAAIDARLWYELRLGTRSDGSMAWTAARA